jgi:succinate dehydrogenase / fumarate reductase cytochrome b subunit
MSSVLSLYKSSVGKKFVVGLTGLFLCSFLLVHLAGNLLLFKQDGGAAFNSYAEFMSTNEIIRAMEIVLFAGFIIHIITSSIVWAKNRAARPKDYKVQRKNENSKLSSRVSFLTGSVIYIFLMVHLESFWYQWRYHPDLNPSIYNLVKTSFSSAAYCGFYIFAMILLGLHLKHGFQSAFQTFGIKGKRYESIINAVGVFFWLIVPIAFSFMPIHFLIFVQ